MKILFVFPNVSSPGYKPVSISTLCALAKQKGHEVRLYDTSFYETGKYHSISDLTEDKAVGESIAGFIPVDEAKYGLVKEKIDLKKDFLDLLSSYKPELVLVSALSMEFGLTMYLLNLVKGYDENIKTLVGGRHCYVDPEEVIRQKSVDMICIGEGEKPLGELLDALENKADYSGICGLWVKKDGNILRNKLNTYFFDLDSLPYLDLSVYDKRQLYRIFYGKVYRSVDYVMKRGCYEQCGYCQSELVQRWHNNDCSIRRYSVDRAVAELKYLKKEYNLEFVRFHDETFLAIPEKELEYLSEQYIKNVNLPFVIDAAPQTVTKRKTELLKAMGCRSASLGCESGNEEFRYKVLNKRVRNESVIKAFGYLNEVGIRTVMFNLIGFPFETRQHIEDSIKLNRVCNITSPSIGFFYPFKGCKLRETAIENGFFDPSVEQDSVAQWSWEKPFLTNPDISYDEYLGIFRTFILYCKLPEPMFGQIKKAEKDDETFKVLKKSYTENYLLKGR